MSGKGVLVYKNKDEYNGEFFEGKRHGEGKFTSFESKFIYFGAWKAGKQSGLGTLKYPNGKSKKGFFSQGKVSYWLDEKEKEKNENYSNISSSDYHGLT